MDSITKCEKELDEGKMKRIVVLGSNSFSGSHFVKKALTQGNKVLAISRSRQLTDRYRPYNAHHRELTFRPFDINLDLDLIKDEISLFAPDIVISYAAQGMVGESWKNPSEWYETNFLSHVKLVEWLFRKFPCCRFIGTSTPEVYGNTGGCDISENTLYNPSTPYAISKAALDMHLLTMHKNYGFDVVLTRAANIYGPRQLLYRIIPKATLCALTGKILELHGGGKSVRTFIHINDTIDATYEIMNRSESGEIWHISQSDSISIKQLVEKIYRYVGADFETGVAFVGDRLGKDEYYNLNSDKLRIRLGVEPRLSLDTGIKEVVGWARDNYEELCGDSWEYIHKANKWRHGA